MRPKEKFYLQYLLEKVTVDVKFGIVPDTHLRDIQVVLEYDELKQKMKGKRAMEQLAEKHHISVSSINNILFGKPGKKFNVSNKNENN